jgi:hypothetical protein
MINVSPLSWNALTLFSTSSAKAPLLVLEGSIRLLIEFDKTPPDIHP